MDKQFYKYRSLNDLKWTLDIILNNRLYLANFETLNDPCEGHVFMKNNGIKYFMRPKVKKTANKIRICCFSESNNINNMWSLYADSHKGIVIEFTIPENKNIVKIEYIEDFPEIDEDVIFSKDLILNQFSKKLNLWSNEKEHRIISTDRKEYVSIEIKKIYFGLRMSEYDENLLKDLIGKINPIIEFEKITSPSFFH